MYVTILVPQKFKLMEVMKFKPMDESQKLAIEAMKIKNEFVQMGFERRKAFIEVVQSNMNKYRSYQSVNILIQFWVGRYSKEEFLNDMRVVLDNLKNE